MMTAIFIVVLAIMGALTIVGIAGFVYLVLLAESFNK